MKKIYDQYYYASAAELFNKQTTGYGIFGSSTEETEIVYKNLESFANFLVPMPRIDLKTPIEYILYQKEQNKFIAGGATSYESYINNDRRNVSWVHIYVPKTKGEESFIDCLAIDHYDTVRKEEQKIYLEQIELDVPESLDFYKEYDIPFFGNTQSEKKKAMAFLLDKVLKVIFRNKNEILFFYCSSFEPKRESELIDKDFQDYRKMMRTIMSYIYELIPGIRVYIGSISPVVDAYFEKTSKPSGGKFQFGIKSDAYSGEKRVEVDLARWQELEKIDFLSSNLYKMIEVYEENIQEYEEIGKKFKCGREKNELEYEDYIWHYIFEFVELERKIDWTFFKKDDYSAALRQIKKYSYKVEKFFKLTDVLLRDNNEIIQKEEELINIFLKSYRKEFDEEERRRYKEIVIQWILNSEKLQEAVIERGWLEDNLRDKLSEEELEDIKVKIQDKQLEAEEEENKQLEAEEEEDKQLEAEEEEDKQLEAEEEENKQLEAEEEENKQFEAEEEEDKQLEVEEEEDKQLEAEEEEDKQLEAEEEEDKQLEAEEEEDKQLEVEEEENKQFEAEERESTMDGEEILEKIKNKKPSKQVKKEALKWIPETCLIIMIDILLYEGLQWLNGIFNIFIPLVIWGITAGGSIINILNLMNRARTEKKNVEKEILDIYEDEIKIINVFVFATISIIKIIGGLKLEVILLVLITMISFGVLILYKIKERRKKETKQREKEKKERK